MLVNCISPRVSVIVSASMLRQGKVNGTAFPFLAALDRFHASCTIHDPLFAGLLVDEDRVFVKAACDQVCSSKGAVQKHFGGIFHDPPGTRLTVGIVVHSFFARPHVSTGGYHFLPPY